MNQEDRLTLDEIVELIAARYAQLSIDQKESEDLVRSIITLAYKMGAFRGVFREITKGTKE